jgi:predicted transglutaminase-like cysteine proteinase
MNPEKPKFFKKARNSLVAGLALFGVNAVDTAEAKNKSINPNTNKIEQPLIKLVKEPTIITKKQHEENKKAKEQVDEEDLDEVDLDEGIKRVRNKKPDNAFQKWVEEQVALDNAEKYQEALKSLEGKSPHVVFEKTPTEKATPKAFDKMREQEVELCNRIIKYCERINYVYEKKHYTPLTPEVFKIITNVNNSVNALLEPTPDLPGQDNWNLATQEREKADCDEYMIRKKEQIEHESKFSGDQIPSNSFTYSFVRYKKRDGTVEGHAVLIFHSLVDNKKVDWVLDNIYTNLLPINKSPHEFVLGTGEKGWHDITTTE